MKTFEFIEEIQKLGLNVNKSHDSVRAVINISMPKKNRSGYNPGKIAVVSTTNMYEVSCRWEAYTLLKNSHKKILWDLIKAYVETEIEDRI
ncbi:hypothetical protein [Lysinibacillus capsici]|uniref:hypothetical protein n=1 Tax=Lysinibacillus capsici TaxID=2115968 RepID=UPI000E205DE8|nr:hypothetical protein [Lysinibacillus capsici]RDV35894.1 hypothetical protein C7B89_00025 [Lysinibacillus capsici]